MTLNKDAKIVKIAVKMEAQMPNLTEFDQVTPLNTIIDGYLTYWNINEPSNDYALQFTEPPNNNFVTQKNRHEIKNGTILKLTHSPAKLANDTLEKLRTGSVEDKKTALQQLVKLSMNATFANEFVTKNGKDFLISLVDNNQLKGEELGYALEAFVELMNHGIFSWDSIDRKFIEKIYQWANSGGVAGEPKVLINSLAILENLFISGAKWDNLVDSSVMLPNLMYHIKSNTDNPLIQQNAIALINSLFIKADIRKRKGMASFLSKKINRQILLENVINVSSSREESSPAAVRSEMAHQLYVLQSLIFNIHEERIHTKPSQNPQFESYCQEKIHELCRTAFENESPIGPPSSVPLEPGARSKSVMYSTNVVKNASSKDDHMRLGFTNRNNPTEDFNESPPGLLAIDFMSYFASNYTETYTKVVLENSCRSDRDHECPFVRSSIDITKLICEIFKVGEAPSDEGKVYYPMLFDHNYPLEEFFCICVPLLNKTWKEMKANIEDFDKVFFVLREQLKRTLGDHESVVSFEKFKVKLASFTYTVIINLLHKERSSREEWENNAQPILELKQKLEPEMKELIKKQRLQYLTEGTMFGKYSNKGQRVKDKFWFCRLSSKFKVLYYGDCEENQIPTIDELPQKLNINDIKYILVGKNCAHMKESKNSKKSTSNLAFSLVPDTSFGDPLNFVAPDEKVLHYWTDGINALLGNEMTSKEALNDLKTLLLMEIKMRLMDTEGITIPEKSPKIPPPPENFDFKIKFQS